MSDLVACFVHTLSVWFCCSLPFIFSDTAKTQKRCRLRYFWRRI